MDDERKVEIIPYTKADYELLGCWWEAREKPAPSVYALASGTGLIAKLNGEPKAAAWLYLQGEIAFAEWLVTEPKITVADARLLCRRLGDDIELRAKIAGVKELLGWVVSIGMAKEAEKRGFKIGGMMMSIQKDLI